MWAAILAAIQSVPLLIKAYQDWVAMEKQKSLVDWQVKLQTGLAPLEQPNQSGVTDVQRAAAAKAISDAIASLS